MIEILQFIFSSFWVFIGTVILLYILLKMFWIFMQGIVEIIHGENDKA